MPESLATGSLLYVEGVDDEHTIRHLMLRYVNKPGPGSGDRMSRQGDLPEIKPLGGDIKLLDAVEAAIEAAAGHSAGFVFDADDAVEDRWRAIKERLLLANVNSPEKMPEEGFIGESQDWRTKVGVWIMPDNQRSGKLEDFLLDLIDGNDLLIGHAKDATSTACEIDCRFSEADRDKAVLHTWLAWQERPGRPYGTAIKAEYFRHDSEASSVFVSWFCKLFGISRTS